MKILFIKTCFRRGFEFFKKNHFIKKSVEENAWEQWQNKRVQKTLS